MAAPIVAAVGALAGVVASFTVEIVKTEDPDTAEFVEVVNEDEKSEE